MKNYQNQMEIATTGKDENGPILSLVIGIMGIVVYYILCYKRRDLDLNVLIYLYLHQQYYGTPRRFIGAAADSKKTTGVIYTPFYAGIMGMMTGKC